MRFQDMNPYGLVGKPFEPSYLRDGSKKDH